MKLLYCYILFLDDDGEPQSYRGLEHIELNLSTVDRYTYDESTNTLLCEDRSTPLPEHFWSDADTDPDNDNIYNINVIAGENGSGKTTVVRCVMNTLDFFHSAISHSDIDCLKREESRNRILLLLENEGTSFLLDYKPLEWKKQELVQISGMRNHPPLVVPCHIVKKRRGYQFEKIDAPIASQLLKTKVVHLTNTLNQYDYECHINEKSDRLRDFFIYNASLGSTIGPDVSRFFIYEVYKQVKYVFDKRQYEKRKAVGKRILNLPTPRILRLHLRLKRFREIISDHAIFPSIELEEKTAKEKSYSCIDLPIALSVLCVASFAVNLNRLTNMHHLHLKPLARDEFLGTYKHLSSQEQLIHLILEMKRKFFQSIGYMALEKHSKEYSSLAVLDDGRIVGVDEYHGSIDVWDISTYPIQHTSHRIPEKTTMMIALSNGVVVTVPEDGGLKSWSISEKRMLRPISKYHQQYYPFSIGCWAAFPDEKIISCTDDGVIYIWEADESLSVWKPIEEKVLGRTPQRDIQCITALSNEMIAVGLNNGTIEVWNIIENKLEHLLLGHRNRVNCIVANSRTKQLISGSSDGTIKAWDIENGKCLETVELSHAHINCLALLPDGRIVTNSGDTLEILRMESTLIELKTAVQNLEINCLDYLQFVFNKRESLFSQFRQCQDDTFELSMDSIADNDMLFLDMVDFVDKYRHICEPEYTVDFDWGLSSGEENLLRMFSNLYHIYDRNYLTGQDKDNQIYNMIGRKMKCDTILLFMDEADLTLHPEWQRRLISVLTVYIPMIYPSSCIKDIQLILTTHSPLILGDIPGENVVYLFSNRNTVEQVKRLPGETFGENIHNILKNSFFLNEGTIGSFAARKINKLAERLTELKNGTSIEHSNQYSNLEELAAIRQMIALVAPGVLRAKLEILYREAEFEMRSNGSVRSDMETNSLITQIQALSKEERNLLLQKLKEADSEND